MFEIKVIIYRKKIWINWECDLRLGFGLVTFWGNLPLFVALSHRVPAAGVSWPSWALTPVKLSHHRHWTWLYRYWLNFICLAVIQTAAVIFRRWLTAAAAAEAFHPRPPCFSSLWDSDRIRADVQTEEISSLSPATKGLMPNQEVESVTKVKTLTLFVTWAFVPTRKKKHRQ